MNIGSQVSSISPGTPTSASQGTTAKQENGTGLYGHDYSGQNGSIDGDDGIQMTFDTSFEDPPHNLQRPSAAKDRTISLAAIPSSDGRGIPEPVSGARPEIKTAQTVPNITLSDPWAGGRGRGFWQGEGDLDDICIVVASRILLFSFFHSAYSDGFIYATFACCCNDSLYHA